MDDPDLKDRAAAATLTEPEQLGGGLYRYERYRVSLADHSDAFSRDVVRVGGVVVLIPVDLARDEVVLIREFRLGAHIALDQGDLLELPAGRVERGEEPIVAAHRECEEEIGVAPQRLVPIFSMMPSPGMSDEHMTFFLAMVDATKVPERAGATDEQEDIRPMRVPIDRALQALASGAMHYGAAVVGLQWLALNRARLPEIAAKAAP